MPFKLRLEFLCLHSSSADDNAGPGGVDVDTTPVCDAFNFNARDTGTRQFLFDELLNLKIFMEPSRVIAFAIPL